MNKLLNHTRRPDIAFNRNGIIRITARVARALSLQPGDTINITLFNNGIQCRHMQGETCSCPAERRRNCNLVEYLLSATRHTDNIGRYEAQCYPTKKGSNDYRANSVRLCRTLLDSAGITDPKAAFMVGEIFQRDSITYIPIITRRPL